MSHALGEGEGDDAWTEPLPGTGSTSGSSGELVHNRPTSALLTVLFTDGNPEGLLRVTRLCSAQAGIQTRSF